MAAVDEMIRSYGALRDAAERERDEDKRTWLLDQAEKVYANIQAVPDWERGDGTPTPSKREAKGTPTVTAGATSLPPAELARVAEFAQSNQAPGINNEFPSNAAHGASSQPNAAAPARSGIDTSLVNADIPYRPNVSGVQSVAAEVQPTAPPQPAQQGIPGMSFDEFERAFGGGRGSGVSRGQLSGAAANAGAAGAASDAADAAEREAILKRGAQGEADGRQLGETMAAFAQQLKLSEEERQAVLVQGRQRIGRLINESKQATEEFRMATREQGLMASLSTGGRVGAAISLALGALGGGLTGNGQNAALDVLKFRVDEDLRNRQLNINAKGQAADAVDRLLTRNMEIFGDEVSALEATRSAMFDSLKLEVNRQAAISGGVDKQQAAQQLVAGMEAEKARADEVLANQQLQALLKQARSGGGKSRLELYKAWLETEGKGLGNMKAAAELSNAGAATKPDIYSAEGKRASDRMTRLYSNVKPADSAIESGKLLLEKTGVPSVLTRARANLDTWFDDNPGLLATTAGVAAIPFRTLSKEENEQMSALMNFTINQQKALDPRISNQDLEIAVKRLVRQSMLVSQDSLAGQVRQQVEEAKKYRADALASDPEAAAEYEAEQRKRRGEVGASGGGRGVPDYGNGL